MSVVYVMPTGVSDVLDMAAMTDLTDMTHAQLAKEFEDDGSDQRKSKEEEEDEEQAESEEAFGGQSCDGVSRTPSSDRPSSSDSLKTTSGRSASDQPSEEGAGSFGDGAMPEDAGKKRKNSAQAIWKSVKKAGAELNSDTRKVIRFIGRKLPSRRGSRETKVKEIHILPGEDDDRMWARRMAGSANSHSSSGSDPST